VSLREKAAAWWAVWQWVILVLLLLTASIALNVWQWKRAITAPYRAEIASKDRALDDSAALLASARERAQLLDAAADRVTHRISNAGEAYDRATKRRPLTDSKCAPGQARMDAVNQALGAIPQEKQ